MPYHIVIRLPDGRVACADYREAIAQPMHKINAALAECKTAQPELYEQVAAWLDEHAEQSAACHKGLLPAGPDCGHD